MNLITIVEGLLKSSGYATMTWQQLVMLVISFILMYLAIVKQFEPLLLLPISFGIFMSNLPHSGTFEYFYQLDHWYDAGVLGVMYMGVKSSFFPCMMFLAVGAMTDFGPLIANPISLLLGAAALRMRPASSLRSRQRLSASSAALTARRRSMSQTTSLPSWSHRLRLRRTATWR